MDTEQLYLGEDFSEEAKRVFIHNRKYLGSKRRLLDFLADVITSKVTDIGTFVDGFAGTGAVALRFSRSARKVVANDILISNAVILRAFLMSHSRNVSLPRVRGLIEELNRLPPSYGYAYRNYRGTYFSDENAALIDAVRERIDELREKGGCTEQEKNLLLASLLFAVDKVANTVGQYDAFLKNLKGPEYDELGRHLVDKSARKKLRLFMPHVDLMEGHEVHCEDFNNLAKRIRADVLYLDPPYNTRQYVDCYHVLENIVRWDKPLLRGKTRKFPRERFKSDYSRRGKCETAFRELIRECRAEHVFLSYNNEGIIRDDTIIQALHEKGKVEIFEKPYGIFGNGAGRSVKRKIVERLFYCRVGH